MAAPGAALRRRLAAGDTLVGTFLKLPALETVDVAAAAGFDFVVVDLEHAQLDEQAGRLLVRHALALRLPAVVRVPQVDPGQVNRLLEAGAAGLQLSSTRSLADADALRAASRYAPEGRRSISLAHPAADYGAAGLQAYLDEQRAGPLLIAQIETATTDDPLADVLAGLDVAFVGSTDLSVDLGLPGELGHPTVRARIAEIAEASRTAGTVLGGWVATPGDLDAIRRDGARYLMVGSDLQLLRSSVSQIVADVRRGRDG